jgi:hypothetical protein
MSVARDGAWPWRPRRAFAVALNLSGSEIAVEVIARRSRRRRAADRARGRDPEAEPIRAQLRAGTPVFAPGLRLDRDVLE